MDIWNRYITFNEDNSKTNGSKFTMMKKIFCDILLFNENISRWNAIYVTYMSHMFKGLTFQGV
jgi:hypothetical protein